MIGVARQTSAPYPFPFPFPFASRPVPALQLRARAIWWSLRDGGGGGRGRWHHEAYDGNVARTLGVEIGGEVAEEAEQISWT